MLTKCYSIVTFVVSIVFYEFIQKTTKWIDIVELSTETIAWMLDILNNTNKSSTVSFTTDVFFKHLSLEVKVPTPTLPRFILMYAHNLGASTIFQIIHTLIMHIKLPSLVFGSQWRLSCVICSLNPLLSSSLNYTKSSSTCHL